MGFMKMLRNIFTIRYENPENDTYVQNQSYKHNRAMTIIQAKTNYHKCEKNDETCSSSSSPTYTQLPSRSIDKRIGGSNKLAHSSGKCKSERTSNPESSHDDQSSQ